jgi:hypothetical protein
VHTPQLEGGRKDATADGARRRPDVGQRHRSITANGSPLHGRTRFSLPSSGGTVAAAGPLAGRSFRLVRFRVVGPRAPTG